jgi:hypothetical protein
MQRHYFLSIILIFANIYIDVSEKNTVTYPQQYLNCNSSLFQNSATGNIVLVFEVSGMNSENDAKIIDDILKQKSYVISSSTDFNTGICKVVTDDIVNKDKIRESICSASKKVGNKIIAELVNDYFENNQNR